MATVVALSRFGPRERAIGVAGALALHLLALCAAVWGLPDLRRPPPEPPAVIEVEFEPPPPPPPLVANAPPPPAPEALFFPPPPPPVLDPAAPVGDRSRPAPAPGPESLRPGPAERPAGSAREAPAPPAPRAAPAPTPPAPTPPAAPVIIRGGSEAQPTGPRRITPPSLVDQTPFAVGRADRAAGSGGAAEAIQRSEGDFILGQVMPHWLIDHRSPRFRYVLINGPFILNADGTLASPYGKHDPWRPEVMIGNWAELQRPDREHVLVALETFLRAVRNAQPFKLPPNVAGGYPRQARLYFQLGDL